MGLCYDDNGNILALQRRGLLAAGNRLQAVNDRVTGNELPRPAGYHGAPASLAGDF